MENNVLTKPVIKASGGHIEAGILNLNYSIIDILFYSQQSNFELIFFAVKF